mgnify:CR=1 FL=1
MKNPYTYMTKAMKSTGSPNSRIQMIRKKQNELFVIIYFHIFDENLKIVSNYE